MSAQGAAAAGAVADPGRDAIVVGAGIVGLATAWALQARGLRVTVIERGDDVGQGASFANGAQLVFRFIEPVVQPGFAAYLPRWLLSADSGVQVRMRADPAQWRWLLAAAASTRASAYRKAVDELGALGRQARSAWLSLLSIPSLAAVVSARGKLVVFSDEPTSRGYHARLASRDPDAAAAGRIVHLDRDACVAEEPRLAQARVPGFWGVLDRDELTADCLGMMRAWRDLLVAGTPPVTFLYGRNARTDADGRRVSTDRGETLTAGAVVIAAGQDSRGLDPGLPLWPVGGCSVAFASRPGTLPAVSVTDYDAKVVLAPLHDRLRVAGFASIEGRVPGLQPRAFERLAECARRWFPAAADGPDGERWQGVRPTTPDSVPILGRRGTAGPFRHTGHGGLGYSLAPATALRLAEEVHAACRAAASPAPAVDRG